MSPNSPVFPRLEIHELQKHHNQFLLFVLSYLIIQQRELPAHLGTLSLEAEALHRIFNQVAGSAFRDGLLAAMHFAENHGIHEISHQLEKWKGEGKFGEIVEWSEDEIKDNSGLCDHGSVLFPTGHRPYLLAIEESIRKIAMALAVLLDASTLLSPEDKYIEAARRLRFPFWAWDTPGVKNLPRVLTDEEIEVRIYSKSVLVPNPLSYYVSKAITHGSDNITTPDARENYYSAEWSRTVRYGTSHEEPVSFTRESNQTHQHKHIPNHRLKVVAFQTGEEVDEETEIEQITRRTTETYTTRNDEVDQTNRQTFQNFSTRHGETDQMNRQGSFERFSSNDVESDRMDRQRFSEVDQMDRQNYDRFSRRESEVDQINRQTYDNSNYESDNSRRGHHHSHDRFEGKSHKGEADYVGLDPIFYLHRSNVDRLHALREHDHDHQHGHSHQHDHDHQHGRNQRYIEAGPAYSITERRTTYTSGHDGEMTGRTEFTSTRTESESYSDSEFARNERSRNAGFSERDEFSSSRMESGSFSESDRGRRMTEIERERSRNSENEFSEYDRSESLRNAVLSDKVELATSRMESDVSISESSERDRFAIERRKMRQYYGLDYSANINRQMDLDSRLKIEFKSTKEFFKILDSVKMVIAFETTEFDFNSPYSINIEYVARDQMPQFIGSFSIFTREDHSICEHCRKRRDLTNIVHGVIPIPRDVLVDAAEALGGEFNMNDLVAQVRESLRASIDYVGRKEITRSDGYVDHELTSSELGFSKITLATSVPVIRKQRFWKSKL